MRHSIILIVAMFSTASMHAAELERGTITSCAYQAGTAYEIQKIRQVEGDDWPEFEHNIKQIYKDTQGRQDLLDIAKRVYIQPPSTPADAIHEQMFNACVQRQQGTEPKV